MLLNALGDIIFDLPNVAQRRQSERDFAHTTADAWVSELLLCVVMPLHNGQVGSFPPSGRQPTLQMSPARYMFLCSPYGD